MFIPICCLGSSSGVGSGSDGWSDGEGVGVVGSGRLWFGVGGMCGIERQVVCVVVDLVWAVRAGAGCVFRGGEGLGLVLLA